MSRVDSAARGVNDDLLAGLSGKERQDLAREALEGTPVWAKNQTELAGFLGCNRKTIQRWLKEEKGPGKKSDGRYDVKAWQEWVNLEGRLAPTATDSGTSEKHKLEIERARLTNEKLQIENRVRMGQLLSVEEVCRTLGDAFAGVVRVMNAMHHTHGPTLAGKGVADAKAILAKANREALGEFALGAWAEKKNPGWAMLYAKLQDLQRIADLGGGPSSTA